ncbi:MAG: hypothetical protein IT410_01765 [Candidatus Doudnabacteria bacterium]|nr:hypothetical protein [Candidatus Doudnabacteria bacterium]
MEQMQNQTPSENPSQTQEQMLQEILESTRKTKNYMKWQLIITVALVVLPLLATVAIIPFVLSAVNGIYDTSGLLQ